MTGFTGSAGTVVFTEEKAGLWTDGRYFIQAEQELQGSEIILFKAGEPGCPGNLKNLYGQNCRKAERSDLMAVRFG